MLAAICAILAAGLLMAAIPAAIYTAGVVLCRTKKKGARANGKKRKN